MKKNFPLITEEELKEIRVPKEELIEMAIREFNKALNIVVLTGAGISAESGIPTFRDENGIWRNFDPQKVCTASTLYENPQTVLDWMNELRMTVYNAQPNHAHLALAELEKSYTVTIITQNVDDLHERAGSTNVIHLHGELCKVTSSERRTNPDCIMPYPMNVPIHVGDKAADGSQLRPYVVMMDEYISSLEYPIQLIRDADVFVVIGTSMTIGAGAILYNKAHPYIPKFIIDPKDYTSILPDDFQWIPASATQGVDELIKMLAKL